MDAGRAADDPTEERTLIARVREGDERAFEEVVHRWEGALFRYVRGWMDSDDEALDVLQDVFFRVWRFRETLEAPYGLRVFLYVSARSQALNALRGDTRRRRRDGVYAAEVPDRAFADDSGETEASALSHVVRRVVEHLPPRTRDVWRLCREEGLTYEEAAVVLGISVNTVKTQMGRAFRTIRTAAAPFFLLLVVAKL